MEESAGQQTNFNAELHQIEVMTERLIGYTQAAR
jgi:hypothetical protein